MEIYFKEICLQEGFEVLKQEKREARIVAGRQVSQCSGWGLFRSMHQSSKPITCWNCGISADRWVVTKGRRDKVGAPVLNLFAGLTMMTRDHIIPRSLGGKDDLQNLRPGCTRCNEERGNKVTPEVIEFAQKHPELIDDRRIKDGLESLQRHLAKLEQYIKQNEKANKHHAEEIERLKKPYQAMGYL